MLTLEFIKTLELLKGDFKTFSVYAFLCTIAETQPCVISLRKISELIRTGRPRLMIMLGELKSLGLLDYETTQKGTRLVIPNTTKVSFITTNAHFQTPLDSSITTEGVKTPLKEENFQPDFDKSLETLTPQDLENLVLTGSHKFLKSGLSASDGCCHLASPNGLLPVRKVLTDLDFSDLGNGNGNKTGLGNGNGNGNGYSQTTIESSFSGSPKADPLERGRLTKILNPAAAKKRSKKITLIPYSQQELELGASWFAYATQEMDWAKPPSSWSPEKFASELGKVRRIKEYSIEQMWEILRFVRKHDFWKTRALSPASLLNKSKNNGDMRKIDFIVLDMKPKWVSQLQRMKDWDRPLTKEELENPFLIED